MTNAVTNTDRDAIETACESFLADWNRGDWAVDHGEWASAEWDDAREEYDAAVEALAAAVKAAAPSERAGRDALADVRAALKAAEAAAEALDGQVRPDESDYIAEGTIDPDDVSGDAESLDVGASWQGWDCQEGWSAHRSGDDLYLNWWRSPYPNTNRHQRDLWVLVRKDFFAAAEEDAA
jgi:hypothetical protein